MNICHKAVETWDRLLHRSVAALLAAAMTLSFLPATSWAVYPITPPVQITDATKSEFPNIEFQTNFVRTEYGTLTGLMELAIRVGPSAKDGSGKPIPVSFQSVAATLQYNTALFTPISWQWAYNEDGSAPDPVADIKIDGAKNYYDIQLPAKKDDTLPGTGAIAQCGILEESAATALGMSTNVAKGDQALLFFKAEAYGTQLETAEMTTLAVIRFYVAPELMEHISIVRDKTSVQPDGSCDYDVFFDTDTQVTDRAELDAAILKTKGQTVVSGAPAGALDPDLTKMLPTDFISVGFALDGDMAESDSPANMSLHYSAGDNVFYYVPSYVPTDDPATNTTLTDVPTEVGPDKGKVKVTLRAPITGGSRVLAVAEGKDNSTTAADYSYTSNLIPSENITFSVVSQVSFADNGDGRENMATVLFYDWDDTLIGVLVVPRNDDARALVNDYVRDHMIHPDLRYVEGSADTLVDSLSRANSYRGKYPSTPMGENGTDTTMDGNRPATPEGNDKLVGSDYPLTNKLDYVFLKRPMEKDEAAVDTDGNPTNTWKQLGDETKAEWDYEYPYIHGWALIPDDDLTDIQYTHPKNIWTTIGRGELTTYTGLIDGAYPNAGAITAGAPELVCADSNFELANFDFHSHPQEKGAVYAVKAVYEPGENLLASGYAYQMISEPYYNKMNTPAANSGGAYSVDVIFERSNLNNSGVLCGVARARDLQLRQETTSDLRWENEYLENATIAQQSAKTKTTFSTGPIDNVDDVKIQLVLSGRHNKVDYYLMEAYGASFVTGGGRSRANSSFTGTAHVIDNYNYNTADNNTDRVYYRAEYIDTDGDGVVNDDRSGSYGFVLICTLNNLGQKATEYVRGNIDTQSFNSYFSLDNFLDVNLRINNAQVTAMTRATVRSAWQAAAQAAQVAHNSGDNRWWDVEHDCAQFTYHVIQFYVSDFVANGSATLRDPDTAELETIAWCNLHEECAASRSGKPTSWAKMVKVAKEKTAAEAKDAITLLTMAEAEAMSHLRADERGTAFADIGALADAFIAAVKGIDAIDPLDPDNLTTDDWDAIQGWILSDPKPANAAQLNEAIKLSQGTAWWNEGEDAPRANSLQNIVDATKKALDTGRDAWINYYRYQEIFEDMKTNGVTPQAQWTMLTENLVKNSNGDAFDDYDQFRTAIKNAVVALGTNATWNELQYYILHGTDPAGDPNASAEYPSYWWHFGYSRVTSLATMFVAAQEAAKGNTTVWDMFSVTDLYDPNLTELHFRSGFNGTTDKYTAANFNNFKSAVLAFLQEPGVTIATSDSEQFERDDSWNQLQYYIIHRGDAGGCDFTDIGTVTAYQEESANYYWWKNGADGAVYTGLTPGISVSNVRTLMEAAYRHAVNGNPKAFDRLDLTGIETFRLIPAYDKEAKPATWGDLDKFDDVDAFIAKMDNLIKDVIAAGSTGSATTWRVIQHYILTGVYLPPATAPPTLPSESRTDPDGYWWKEGNDNPGAAVGPVKTAWDEFIDSMIAYMSTNDDAAFEAKMDEYFIASQLDLRGLGNRNRVTRYGSLTGSYLTATQTTVKTLAYNLKNTQGVTDATGINGVLDWYVLQFYMLQTSSSSDKITTTTNPLVTKEAAKTYCDGRGYAPPAGSVPAAAAESASLMMLAADATVESAAMPEPEGENLKENEKATVITEAETPLPDGSRLLVKTITTVDPALGTTETITIVTLWDADGNLVSEEITTNVTQGAPDDPAEGEAPVCTCGTEDGVHDEDCPLYVAPEELVCTCGSEDGTHAEDCPLYVVPEEPICTCGTENGVHAEDCPLYVAPIETEAPTESFEPTESAEPSESPEATVAPEPAVSPEPTESVSPEEELPETSIPGAETPEVSLTPEVTETPEAEPTDIPEPTPTPEVTVTPEGALETMPEIIDPDPPASEPPGNAEEETADKSVGTEETTTSPPPSQVAVVVETMPPLGIPRMIRTRSAAMDYKKLTTKIATTKLRTRAGGMKMKQLKLNRMISPPGRLEIPLLLRTETMERRSAV